ncbi:TDT family transporter [Spongisporangium articulatum]|uniref:TDT family transporter n=1 Tax=Spongisporangium articulatum TaxID=3362603 RepID=A0ABW8ASU7_9ACTN
MEHVPPNWFATVMGTGIVAVGAKLLPVSSPLLDAVALVFWLLAVAVLAGVGAAYVGHWVRHPDRARAHLSDPVVAHFHGAVPMALLTVGAGTLLVGSDVLGPGPALCIDWGLWLVGTLLGLATAVGVPYLAITRHAPTPAFGGWLMPVVPPMVSASTGALLAPSLSGQAATTLLAACAALFGASLLAALCVIAAIWQRLATQGVGAAAAVPTVWIVLGPLGQSITAANGLANRVPDALRASAVDAAVVFGLCVWGFALLWLALALGLTLRTARTDLPFSLTWWSFTFPLGTVVTGTSALAVHTELDVFRWTAVLLFTGLLALWSLVAARTVRGLATGAFRAPRPAPSAVVRPRRELDYAI